MTYCYSDEIFEVLQQIVFSEIPFIADVNENETIAKCSMLLLTQIEQKVQPYVLNIFKTCLFSVIEKESWTASSVRREIALFLTT